MRGKDKGGRGSSESVEGAEWGYRSANWFLYYRTPDLELILDIRSISDLHFIQRAV
jgi:hypothetical protein